MDEFGGDFRERHEELRVRAYQLRVEGKSFEEIGKIIGHDTDSAYNLVTDRHERKLLSFWLVKEGAPFVVPVESIVAVSGADERHDEPLPYGTYTGPTSRLYFGSGQSPEILGDPVTIAALVWPDRIIEPLEFKGSC